MKRTFIVPLRLPRLSDTAATDLVELLHELTCLIEHHYAAQIHRHRKRSRGSCRPPPPSSTPDSLF